MLRRIALLGLALLLSACESMQVTSDYNPSVDFARFQTWAWKDPALQYQPNSLMLKSDLTEQRIMQAVSSGLDQRGLRPVTAGNKPDLLPLCGAILLAAVTPLRPSRMSLKRSL